MKPEKALDLCDGCGKRDDGVAWWGPAYRKKELRNGRDDPGNLCGECSGARDGKRIGQTYVDTWSQGKPADKGAAGELPAPAPPVTTKEKP